VHQQCEKPDLVKVLILRKQKRKKEGRLISFVVSSLNDTKIQQHNDKNALSGKTLAAAPVRDRAQS
jgi:hypothetical protein